MAFGVAGAPAAAVPNGMMQGTQVVQVTDARLFLYLCATYLSWCPLAMLEYVSH